MKEQQRNGSDGLLAGTYYIKEDMTLYCTGAQTSAYSFDFQAGDCFEKEYNNTKETATKIRDGQTVYRTAW